MPMSETRDRERERDSESRRSSSEGIRDVATYQQPGILAALNGKPVRIIALGDMPGHSTVCQYVDEDGRLNWDDQNRFTVVDSNFLPPSNETLKEVFRQLTR